MRRLTLLKELRTLNLYNTRVTDGCIESLLRIPSLQTVYFWKSNVTPGGAKRLLKRMKKRHAKARVVLNPGLPKPPRRR
jgi:hypothetical protein